MTLQPLCQSLDTALLANLLTTVDKQGSSPAIDYLLDTLAGQSANDRLADVLLCYAILPVFKESVLARYLDDIEQANRVSLACVLWNTAPGRWVGEHGKLVLADPNARLELKRVVLGLFPEVKREVWQGSTNQYGTHGHPVMLRPIDFLPPIW